jgi:prostatin (serine protease 8)
MDSEAGKYPWIAVFSKGTDGSNAGLSCAATLVATNWAVTAAHCITEITPRPNKDNFRLVLGEFDLTDSDDSDDTKRMVVRLAMNPIVHPNYQSPEQNSNDIALLKLDYVDLNVYTPACLPVIDTDFTGKTGTVYGWGYLEEDGSISKKLQEIDIPIVSDTVCQQEFVTAGLSGKVSSDMMCAGAQGKDSCQGDSGGPLTVKDSDQHQLAGVVSWGYGCAAGYYGVYSEVAKLRSWIDKTMEDNGGATFCTS